VPLDSTTATEANNASVVVVIPTYNERENIDGIIRGVLGLGSRYRVLIVDDNSPDGTAAIVTSLAEEFPGRVELLSRSKKDGIGRAYVAGFGRALEMEPGLIAQMDADFSHLPDDLAHLVELASQYDLVLASRYVDGGKTIGWPWHRKLISRFGGLYAGLILGVPIKDLTGGFKVWRPDVLRTIELSSIHSDGYCFQIETTYRAIEKDRVAGKSKLSRRVVFEAMVLPWNLRLRRVLGRSW
jgi:dolichol-phosphate mannosyltransferase